MTDTTERTLAEKMAELAVTYWRIYNKETIVKDIERELLAHGKQVREEIHQFIRDGEEWSLRTFGEGYRSKQLANHLRKEIDEIEANPRALEEYVDVILLALDGA